MIDTSFSSSDQACLASFCANYACVIGPLPGCAAQAEQTMEDGIVCPASAAKGDPSLYYACIRAETAPVPPSGISVCDAATGVLVLGVWA